jgi:hypothetical protein
MGTGLSGISRCTGVARSMGAALVRAPLAAVVLTGLLAGAPGASADAQLPAYTFGEPGSGAGQLSSPAGVAVNPETHDVYVADPGNHRIDEYEQDGVFIRAFGYGVSDGLGMLESCTALLGCQEGLAGSQPGQLENPTFIAIDTSTGPSAGDLYVADTANELITEYNAQGELQESWGDGTPAPDGQLAGKQTTPGSLGEIAGISVDSTGTLEVLNTADQVFRFAQDSTLTGEMQAGSSGTLPDGLALDATGDLFKLNGNATAEELTPTGGETGTVSTAADATGLTVDQRTSELYLDTGGSLERYAFTAPGIVEEPRGSPCTVTPGGGCAPSETLSLDAQSAGASLTADSSNGTLYVAEPGSDTINALTAHVETSAASARTPTSALLHATVDPAGEHLTGCRLEYVTQAAFQAAGFSDLASGGVVPCNPAAGEIPPDGAEHSVSAAVTHLSEGQTHEYRLAVSSAAWGTLYAKAETVTTTTPPQILPGSASAQSSARSAELKAAVNPENGASSYQFEYGPSTAYGTSVPIPAASIGEGEKPVTVSQSISGLEPDVTYHWRIVASNLAGTVTGVDHTFIYDEAGPGLPDGRAYEMVTPPQKNGTLIGDFPFGFPPTVSADGSRVIIGTVQCFGGAGSCTAARQSIGTIYAFTRSAADWSATPLAPPATLLEENTWFSANAETGGALFTGPTPPGGEDDFYARRPEGAGASFPDIGPLSPPSAGPNLLAVQSTIAATNADYTHVVFDTEPVWPFAVSDPGTHSSLFEYNEADPSGEPGLVGVSGGLDSRDEISACETAFAGSPPDESVSADGRRIFFVAQNNEGIGPCSGTGANAAKEVPVEELYARVDGGEPGAHTVAISQPRAPQVSGEPVEPTEACTSVSCREQECTSVSCQEDTSPGNPGAWSGARFEGASTDGSEVLFTSPQQLTDTATEDSDPEDRSVACRNTEGENGCNLYLYDFGLPAGHRLLDVSGGAEPVAGGPRVQGVLAFSSDGSHAYFVAKGVLTKAARPGCIAEFSRAGVTGVAGEERCKAQEGAENVYAYDGEGHGEGRLAFVAALDKSLPDGEQIPIHLGGPANVTPDGRFLVFTAADDLTADDTRPDDPEDGAQQVFRYDASTETLVRVSIGERGFDDDGNAGAGDALIVPGERGYKPPGVEPPGERRLDPTMSDDGDRVFFMSPVALAPGALSSVPIGDDVEGRTAYAENVYEWEQPGAGTCPAEQTGGCVSLLSDRRDTSVVPVSNPCEPSVSSVCLAGSDASGSNVFFSTADPLVPGDSDTQLDFYDARVCEPANGDPCITEPISAQPCPGEACHGTPPATPSLQTPGTASFNGAGNLTPAFGKPSTKVLTRSHKLVKALGECRKRYEKSKKRRVACEAAARHKYGPPKAKKTKKTHHSRGTK